MSGNPDSSDADDVPDLDSAFGKLLAEVARGPKPTLLPEGAMVGEYRVVRQLGRGAFGAVYHATHTVIGKQVALKVLGAQFSEDASMAARFVDEARAVNRIAHPNIVDIFGFGSLEDGRKYCVMELLTGETLGACLHRRGHLPMAEATDILTQVASALDAAHRAGIVHRDLKPDNIFLCRPPQGVDDSDEGVAAPVRVKLLDFGIAQIADGVHMRTGSNMMLGTPGYMSPEQCRGANIDFRSDIYALGVVAFELLTGSLPFRGTNAFQVTSKHLTLPPPAPSAHLSTLSEQVDSAVLRMLSKTPSDRPSSALQAVRALAGSTTLPPVSSASAVSSAVPAPSPERKRWLPLATAVMVGAAAVSLGARFVGGESGASAAPKPPSPTGSTFAARLTSAQLVTTAASMVAASPVSATVSVRLEGQPPTARVFRGQEEIGRLGQSLTLPRSETPLSLSIKAPGFIKRDVSITPSRDQVLEVRLLAAPKRKNPELEY